MNNKNLKVSVIVINFNGKDFLGECLSSLRHIDFPQTQFEIIVVDNNSHDNSVEFIRENYPAVKVIENKINSGFAGGCNLAVDYARGRYIVMLNPDTTVEKNWLKYLVKRIESDKKIAAVNSKALLYYPFIELSISSDIYMKSDFTDTTNFQSVGVLVEKVVLEQKHLQNLVRYSTGFYEEEGGSISARWTKGNAKILIPVDPNYENNDFTITIRSEKHSTNLKTHIRLNIAKKKLVEDKLKSYDIKQYRVKLNAREVKKYFLYAVQNAGVVVFKTSYGRDRGAVVRRYTQNYEIDNSFYNRPTQVNAFSGVSVIMYKDLFKKMGGFDDKYFMYYEDVDLSLRFARKGWKIFYEPKSVLYHIHSGSSKEWSCIFTYHVEKNRLATLITHFPVSVVLREIFIYKATLIMSFLRMLRYRLVEDWESYDFWKDRFELRKKVIIWYISNIFYFIKKRLSISVKSEKSIADIYKGLY